MPVVKGKRDTSPTEYVYQARELRKYTIQKCVGFPKRYTFYVSQPIADLSNEVYNHAIKANSIFPKKAHEARLRREHLLEARASALAMVAEIEVAAELFDIEDKKLSKHFVDCFGDCGMGLGSQISQTYALASANRIDHFFKEYAGIKGYGRYMDDGYLIHTSKEYLQQCLAWLRAICKRYHITLNEKKTHIVKLTHGFTWLKCRWFLTSTGKVVKKIYKRSVTKQRQKLKKFVTLVKNGTMTPEDVFTAFQSWRAYAMHFDAWHTIRNMERLYTQLFGVPA